MTQPMLQLDRILKKTPQRIHGWAMSETYYKALKREIRALVGDDWESPTDNDFPTHYYNGIPIHISEFAPKNRPIPLGEDGLPLHGEDK